MRDVVNLPPVDLRGVSAAGGDIYAMTDSSVDFRVPSGLAVVCTINAARTAVTVPPLRLASRAGLTNWASAPRQGDSLFIYDDGPTAASSDDAWDLVVLATAPGSGASCPTSTGFTST